MRHSWQKEKRRRECMCHFGDDDIVIGHIRLNPVHVFPPIWLTDTEMDFYMDDGDDIYLLTIRNNDKRILTVLYTRKEIRDIVMELPTQGIDRQHLQGIIRALCSVPYVQKLRLGEQKRYALK